MTLGFEQGQRDRFNLTIEEFNHFLYGNETNSRDLFAHKEAHPVQLQSIIGAMSEIYNRDRQEYLGAGLETENSVVLTLFEPDGVWVLEYHDEDKIVVQLKESDRKQFIQEINSRFSEKLYQEVGIDSEDVIQEGQDVIQEEQSD